MCIFWNPDADFHNQFPKFVTPSGGKTDRCGRTCGPLSYVCPLTQLICLGRDPKYDQDNVDDAYDDDADKTMCSKCAACAVLCAPLFVLLDVSLSVPPFFQPGSYKDSCCNCSAGEINTTKLASPKSTELQRT